ncbi:MAG: hypothetical protein V9G29_00935 [Burkholderiaceae bacterium]
MELGGPEVGRGCGGRGIIHGFELLEKLGFHEWGFDYVLLDFLGDVVLRRLRPADRPRHVPEGHRRRLSNDLQSLYVANNVCSRGRVLPQARRQRRRGRHGDQQATTAPARPRPSPSTVGIPVLVDDPGQRRHPPQERQLRDHRPTGRPNGVRCSTSSPRTSAPRRRCVRRR